MDGVIMKYITVKLTIEQARTIANIFDDWQWVQNPDAPKSDPQNRFYQRIADKIYKAIKEQNIVK